MALINIKRTETGVIFDPSPANLDATSDFAVWANLDPDEEHQPTLQGKDVNWWMDDPLPRFVDGQPAATSPAINLTTKKNPDGTPILDPITYVDGKDTNVIGIINFVK